MDTTAVKKGDEYIINGGKKHSLPMGPLVTLPLFSARQILMQSPPIVANLSLLLRKEHPDILLQMLVKKWE